MEEEIGDTSLSAYYSDIDTSRERQLESDEQTYLDNWDQKQSLSNKSNSHYFKNKTPLK